MRKRDGILNEVITWHLRERVGIMKKHQVLDEAIFISGMEIWP